MEGVDDLNEYLLISSVDLKRPLLIKYLERLLDYPDFDPSIDNNKAIIIASEFDRGDLVGRLLKDTRVDPSANYNDAIVRAATDGHLEIVKVLLNDPRVDPSDRQNQALRGAIVDHNAKEPWKSIVKLLLVDRRVDWRPMKSSKMLITIFNEQKSELLFWMSVANLSKDELIQVITEDICNVGKVYKSEIPPFKLYVLADILDVKFYPKDSHTSLCNRITKL